MYEVLALGNPAKNAKLNPKATSTVSKPPKPKASNETNDVDFLDFVPIDNNVDDFDLANILKDISDKENSTSNTDKALAINPPNALVTPPVPEVEMESTIVPSQIVHNVTNQNMQNTPFVPRMSISHSNITINYNFQRVK